MAARRELARVDGLLEELLRAVLPELADAGYVWITVFWSLPPTRSTFRM